jgi:hypothetical protein
MKLVCAKLVKDLVKNKKDKVVIELIKLENE